MTKVWAIIERYADEQRYRPDQVDIAKDLGVTEAMVSRWKKPGRTRPMRPEIVQKISDLTGVDYRQVVMADLIDCGYAIKLDD